MAKHRQLALSSEVSLLPGTAYSYLWRYEHAEGYEDGRKVRPAVIIIATASLEEGETDVYVAPIASEFQASMGVRLGQKTF